ALLSLHALGVSSICFGSEAGKLEPFTKIVNELSDNTIAFDETIQQFLKQGLSYPKAHSESLKSLGLTNSNMMKPNNILGYSYVKAIAQHQLPIQPYTIQRIHNDYHDKQLTKNIASATSVRHELINHHITDKVAQTLPTFSIEQIRQYENKTSKW